MLLECSLHPKWIAAFTLGLLGESKCYVWKTVTGIFRDAEQNSDTVSWSLENRKKNHLPYLESSIATEHCQAASWVREASEVIETSSYIYFFRHLHPLWNSSTDGGWSPESVGPKTTHFTRFMWKFASLVICNKKPWDIWALSQPLSWLFFWENCQKMI